MLNDLQTTWRYALLVLAITSALWIGLRSCNDQRAHPTSPAASAAPSVSPPAPPSAYSHPNNNIPGQPPTASPQTNTASPTSKGIISLTLRFEQGRLVETAREPIAQTTVRPRRLIDGQRGLYHRIVAQHGEVLFENIVPDPRRVPWDTTDDGKSLRGGVVHLDEIPLNLRLPAGVHGQLEVFEATDAAWARFKLDTTTRHVGNFDL